MSCHLSSCHVMLCYLYVFIWFMCLFIHSIQLKTCLKSTPLWWHRSCHKSQHEDKELFKRARVVATFPALAAACRAVLRLAVSWAAMESEIGFSVAFLDLFGSHMFPSSHPLVSCDWATTGNVTVSLRRAPGDWLHICTGLKHGETFQAF